jgi:mannitol-1-phosphate/altronate dehydrogenase
MKLRMLNGSHSFLAYLGYLAGYQHINDCMADENFRKAAHRLMMQEQAPTLRVTGVNLQQYAHNLLARFDNPSLKHRTWQIAMDGSQKLPQRMLESVRWHLQQGDEWPCLALGVAGWMRYVSGTDDAGNEIDIRDPLAGKIKVLVDNSTPEERVSALLSLHEIFGSDLAANEQFVEQVTAAWNELRSNGARAAVAKLSN